MAIRDCNCARRINASSFKAHYYMSEALFQVLSESCSAVFSRKILQKVSTFNAFANCMQLGKLKEALEFAEVASTRAPNSEAADMIARIKGHLATG